MLFSIETDRSGAFQKITDQDLVYMLSLSSNHACMYRVTNTVTGEKSTLVWKIKFGSIVSKHFGVFMVPEKEDFGNWAWQFKDEYEALDFFVQLNVDCDDGLYNG